MAFMSLSRHPPLRLGGSMTNEMQAIGLAIETLLVSKNHRGMATLRQELEPGSYARAADLLNQVTGNVFIITGFPVSGTFETDGPPGALVLHDFLRSKGASPWILAEENLANGLGQRANTLVLDSTSQDKNLGHLHTCAPELIISIERPGEAADGHFYNIKGHDISDQCLSVVPFLEAADCPQIAIGDGGNEVGMGNVVKAAQQLNINPSVVKCDELLVADVSNWGAYGLALLSAYCCDHKNLPNNNPISLLSFIAGVGGVDGVTGRPEATEDGLTNDETERLLQTLMNLFTKDIS